MPKIRLRSIVAIFKDAFKRWWGKDPFRQSAVIAYYAIFSLPGLLVVIITVAGLVYGRDVVSEHLSGQITAVMGKDTADQIRQMVNLAIETNASVWATIIGIATILYGATG